MHAFDWQISVNMKVYLFIKQMRLQSHFDGTPVCLIRYRLTQKATDLLKCYYDQIVEYLLFVVDW